MSLLKAEAKKERIEAKRAAAKEAELEQAESKPDSPYAPVVAKKEPKEKRQPRALSDRAIAWLLNLAMLGGLVYVWGDKYATDYNDQTLAQEVAYRVSRFTGEIAYVERMQGTKAEFILPVGEAPFLLRGDLHTLWENSPSTDVKFLWQNDHFARKRGVVIVSKNNELLQRVDRLIDDGDLGNGAAQLHPRGLWVSLP